ncbi:hypothetical protein B0H12DRAFT_1215281 [Mycena haematopus]|nr:hypothetical protein B0H12DRAFT_1215281 [Mycena haematopus]
MVRRRQLSIKFQTKSCAFNVDVVFSALTTTSSSSSSLVALALSHPTPSTMSRFLLILLQFHFKARSICCASRAQKLTESKSQTIGVNTLLKCKIPNKKISSQLTPRGVCWITRAQENKINAFWGSNLNITAAVHRINLNNAQHSQPGQRPGGRVEHGTRASVRKATPCYQRTSNLRESTSAGRIARRRPTKRFDTLATPLTCTRPPPALLRWDAGCAQPAPASAFGTPLILEPHTQALDDTAPRQGTPDDTLPSPPTHVHTRRPARPVALDDRPGYPTTQGLNPRARSTTLLAARAPTPYRSMAPDAPPAP